MPKDHNPIMEMHKIVNLIIVTSTYIDGIIQISTRLKIK